MSTVKDGSRGPVTRIFINRADRHPIRLPVVFTSSEGRVRGCSIDISESGLLAAFDQPLDVWIAGQLSILVPGHPIALEARIARVDGLNAALCFRTMTARDRIVLSSLLKQFETR